MPLSIHDIVAFVGQHQFLAYVVVGLASGAEAIPVVGAIVPGTAVVLGVSALVPSGAVPLWPLILAASLGAVVGDGVSYWLGHRYRGQIADWRPIRRRPELMARSEDFFERHGRMGVFLARFMPALKAFVPLAAGIAGMGPWQFYSVNIASAVVWAPAHVLAGALLGASFGLLGAVAMRLAILAFLLLVVAWVIARAIRLLFAWGLPLAGRGQERLQGWACARDTWFRRRLRPLLDPERKEGLSLLLFGAALIVGAWIFLGVLEDVLNNDPLVRANQAIYLFLQGFRTSWTDRVMVTVTELGDTRVILGVTFALALWLVSRRAWKAAGYLLAATFGAELFAWLIKGTLRLGRPVELYTGWSQYSFPSGHATVNAALYGFIAFLIARNTRWPWQGVVAFCAVVFIGLIGFSRLYLGAHWVSDVTAGFAFALAWVSLLAIAYIRHKPRHLNPVTTAVVAVAALAVFGGVNAARHGAADLERYAVRRTPETMDAGDWWKAGWRRLPDRRVDLIGELEEPLSLQWAGSTEALKAELQSAGWRPPPEWGVNGIAALFRSDPDLQSLPVLPKLQDGRAPALVLVRQAGAPPGRRLVLRLWPSDVLLRTGSGASVPVWLGAVDEQRAVRIPYLVTLPEEQAASAETLRHAVADGLEPVKIVQRQSQPAGGAGFVLLAHERQLAPVLSGSHP